MSRLRQARIRLWFRIQLCVVRLIYTEILYTYANKTHVYCMRTGRIGNNTIELGRVERAKKTHNIL